MPIILPDLNRNCRDLTFCGCVYASAYSGTAQLPAQSEKSLVAEYSGSSERMFARLMIPFPRDDDGDFHIHVDLTRSKKVTPNASVEDIVTRLEPFIGQKADLVMKGTFRVAELHSTLLRPMVAEYRVGDVQVRMTGGTVAVTGAPVQTISWQIEDDSSASIEMRIRTDKVLTESYIVDGLDLLEIAFKALFGEKNAA